MLVKKGEVLIRDGIPYEVIVADEDTFVIGEMRYLKKEGCIRTNYGHLQAYSNDESINSLADLKFAKRIISNKWFD